MSDTYNPDSPLGQQMKQHIANRMRGSGISEDPDYVAEFLMVLLSNGRSPSEILEEFRGLWGDAVDEPLLNTVLGEVQQGVQRGQQQQLQQQQPVPQVPQVAPTPVGAPVAQPPAPVAQAPIAQAQPAQPAQPPAQAQAQPPVEASSAFANPSPFSNPSPFAKPSVRFQESGSMPMEGVTKTVKSIPSGPSSFGRNNQKHSGHGVSKGSVAKGNGSASFKGKKSFALRNQRNFEKLVDKSLGNNNGSTTQFVAGHQQQTRCKYFPHCRDRNCRHAHPTKVCFQYPNCPNPPGTCRYLHPGEDDELIAELEKEKAHRREEKEERNAKLVSKVAAQIQAQTGISLCKFGVVCQRELCPFGHPTPANRDAKVTIMEWCPANKNCQDPNCQRAHSSPGYKPAPGAGGHAHAGPGAAAGVAGGAAAAAASNKPERTLEQCKFGSRCKNFRCPKRHATTTVMCRDGANCTRIDCYFMHPIGEDCRYGANCKNQNCPYRHPEGRQVGGPNRNMVWTPGSGSSGPNTDQRQFAVPDDQVMEQAPVQEA